MSVTGIFLAPERGVVQAATEYGWHYATGMGVSGHLARALIEEGVSPAEPMRMVWLDGRPSLTGAVGAFGRLAWGEDGSRLWRPHPQAQNGPCLVAWAAKIASEAAARGRGSAKRGTRP